MVFKEGKVSKRLQKLLELIQNKPGITATQLHRLCEERVTLRTIQEDLKYLREEWDGGELVKRGRGYFLEGLVRPVIEELPRQEEEKRIYIKLALDAVRNMKDLAEMHDDIVRELRLNRNPVPFYMKSESFQELDTDDETVRELQEAIVRDSNIAFVYRGEDFYVAPLRIVNFDGIWYLYGYDHEEREANKWKTWLLEEIESLEVYESEKHGIDDEEVEEDLEEAFSARFVPDRHIEVNVRVWGPATQLFRLKEQLPRQKIIRDEKDSLTVQSIVSTFDEVEAEIKSFLPYIEVLKPAELQEKILGELRNYLKSKMENGE